MKAECDLHIHSSNSPDTECKLSEIIENAKKNKLKAIVVTEKS